MPPTIRGVEDRSRDRGQEVTDIRADVPDAPAGPAPDDGEGKLVRDMAHLRHLIDVLHRHVPQEGRDERELALMAGPVAASTAEQHLRAIGTLLATLGTYLRARQRGTVRRTPLPTRRPDTPAGPAESNVDAALAAAAARYIARDLAARRLSEFTSAEGYRLARTLAGIGGAQVPVERLLAEANTIRLHPAPLTDAVSHSAV